MLAFLKSLITRFQVGLPFGINTWPTAPNEMVAAVFFVLLSVPALWLGFLWVLIALEVFVLLSAFYERVLDPSGYGAADEDWRFVGAVLALALMAFGYLIPRP